MKQKRDAKGRFTSSKPECKTTEEKVYATGYKGFEKGLICRGKQYAENTVFKGNQAETYRIERSFCEFPLDVFRSYSPCDENEFARVDALAPSEAWYDNSSVTTKLRVNEKISLAGLCSEAVEFLLSRLDQKKKQRVIVSDATTTGEASAAKNKAYKSVTVNTGKSSEATNKGESSASVNTGYESVSANTGAFSAATNVGYRAAATNVGFRAVATSTGDFSIAISTGRKSAATNSGEYSAATNSGEYSAATNTGTFSVAMNTGYCSVATNTGRESASVGTGDFSVALNSGEYSVAKNTGRMAVATNTGYKSAAAAEGKKSFAIATGIQSRVKGALGCFIACAEWQHDENGEWHPVAFVSGKVDGKKIKADTWYTAKDGKFVEAK